MSLCALALAGTLAACGASTKNESQSQEATGSFPATAKVAFPLHQTLAENSNLVIKVTNSGSRTMPDVAVTLINPRYGTAAQAFGTLLAAPAPGQPFLAGRSRPIWVINQAPGPCGYSCGQGGPGAAVSAYSNTWALGSLAPGDTATFDWHVTAIQPGAYTVRYQVAAGQSGQASATGASTHGDLNVVIASQPREGSINAAGQPVETG